MDLRDPWYGEWSETTLLSGPMKYAHKRLFDACARRSAIVVGNTQRLTNYFEETLPRGTRVACVPNGFDPPRERASRGSEREGLSIGYFGHLMGKRSALPFLLGLRLWVNRSKSPPPQVQVRFVGRGFEGARKAVHDLDLGNIVAFVDPVSRLRAADMMADTYVLLLIANDQPLQIPGKTYEYLAVGRRILAVVDESGATNDLLRDVQGCALAENPEEVATALETLWKEHQSGATATLDRRRFLTALSFDRRAEDFANLIEEAIGRSARA
jgi:glycosyltransferase involved in cell wall biosynthesis